MPQSSPPPPRHEPAEAVDCANCERPTTLPIHLGPVDSASGPSHERNVTVCRPCARDTLTRHQQTCPICRTGADCEAAEGAKWIIRAAGRGARR